MYRKQDLAATGDSHRPLSREAFQNGSRPYANKVARRASIAADMHQSFKDPGRCKLLSENPKTTLRDKLTVLSPLVFNKLHPPIATTPDLPVLKELDEQENLSDNLTKTKRCGVSLKYHSDSEAQSQTIRKKTRCLSPVVEKHSPSLILVAALGETEESITNGIFEELYKNNPNFDLADLLMVEALQHGQEKDSGIISGKVTQDSEVVENTPVEKDVRLKNISIKRNVKSIIQDQTAIDESELEVIEDTPCYVYDRKERVRRNSRKAVNKTTQEIVTLDETEIDAFFSQHVNLNNTENILSPTLAKKINETSSGGSNDDCVITEDQFVNNKLSESDLAVEADIIDCVKSIVDKVCNHLDKYVESLAEQERQIDLSFANNIDDNSNCRSDVFTVSNNKLKVDKDIPHEHNSDESRKVVLKFKEFKKGAPIMNTRRKAIKSDYDPNDAGKSKVLTERTNTSFPINSTKATSTRNKRKLYSPKNYESVNNEIRNQETRVERRRSNVSQTPIATCYRELENARKSQSKDRNSRASARTKKNMNKSRYSMYSDGEDPPFQIRKYTSSSSIGPALSPPRKLDEMFDLIKDNIDNEEKITPVEKKSHKKDVSLYNPSSESEDGDFQKKKNQVHKRLSSSLDVSATKRRRSGTQVNYSEFSSENEGKRTKKSKTIKQIKPRSRKTNKIPKIDLMNERMRVSEQDTLETSFIKQKGDVKNVKELEPALQAPALVVMPLDDDDLKEAVGLENKTHSPAKLDISKIKKENNIKKCEKVTRSTVTKTGKENIKNVSKEKDTTSISSLPGLVKMEETRKDKYYTKDPRKSGASNRSNKARYSMYSDGEDPPSRIRERTSSSSIVSTKAMTTRERSVNPINYIDSHCPTSSSENEHCRAVKLKIVNKSKPRGRKVENKPSTPPVLSPKTRKLNEMFDKIKDNVVNEEKITLVEKKRCRKDLSHYNLSSESEDGDFKKQQYQLRKGISSSSLASATKRRRSATQINYSEYSSEDEGKKAKKSKTIIQPKPSSRKTNKIPKTDLIDERMRVAQQDTSDTSFVNEKVDVKNLEETEPALQQAPALEVMPPDKFNDDVKEAVVLENKIQSPAKLDTSKIKRENNRKKCEKATRSTATKKEKEGGSKENLQNVSKEKDSASVSPLPGLVVETEGTRKDDMTSSIETTLLQKLKKMYTDKTLTLLLNEGDNGNAVLDPNDIIETVLESDLGQSERSIATGGRSPITGHNDLNESPPNIELLNEDFQHRDVHNEGMSESMAEFLGNMRNQLHVQTSSIIPITRMSTKGSARSTVCTKTKSSQESINKSISDAETIKSNPKVVLNTIPPKVEPKRNPVGTPKSKVSSVVLTRLSSEEYEKYLSPARTKKSSETGTPKIVLKRISSDEINRWLPIPVSKDNYIDEQPKKYNTRRTSQQTDTKIPDSVIEKKVKGKISPVKLRFDVVHLTTGGYGTRTLRTQSSTKSKSHATNINKETKTDSIKSPIPEAQTSKNENVIKNSQESSKSSDVTRSKTGETASSVDLSMSKSIASVQDWLKTNVSPSAADNDVMKETLCQVMETLQTTLEEIHQTTGERFIAACMENQEEIDCLKKDIREQLTRFEEKLTAIKKNQMQRACEAIRAYAVKKAQMVKLLQEDIQRVLN